MKPLGHPLHPSQACDLSVSVRCARSITVGIFLLGLSLSAELLEASGPQQVGRLSSFESDSYCDVSLFAPPVPWCGVWKEVAASGSAGPAENRLVDRSRSKAPALPAPFVSVYRDPATGRFTQPPAGVSIALPRRLEVSRRPLIEHRVARPGGGVRVDVSDRFSAAIVATRSADGTIEIRCGDPETGPVADQASIGKEGHP